MSDAEDAAAFARDAKAWRDEREQNEPLRHTFLNDEMRRAHAEWLAEQKIAANRLQPYNFSAWDSEAVPEQEWTLENKIPRRQVCLFSGEGAAGKSTIGLHLCAAHALGRDCLQSLAAQGPAFFIDAEDEISVIHRRLAAVKDHFETSFSNLFDGGLRLFPLAGKDPLMAAPGRGGVILPTHLYNDILRLADELKPQTIVVASSANVYAGSEIDRPQVTQFINLLTRLAIAANGSVVLISHPSLTGINSGTGISGSTQWHNAVRARLMISTTKSDDSDNGLRLIECKKNQYGPPSDRVTLRWRDGMFLPDALPTDFERAAQEASDNDKFITLLRQFIEQGRNVCHKPNAGNYAPAAFAKEDGGSKKDHEKAMQRLFNSRVIRAETYNRFGAERLCFV